MTNENLATLHGRPAAAQGQTAAIPRLAVRDLSKSYGTGPAGKEVIRELNFEVAAGEFVCIVGPSGVGKTTLLKCLSGLLPVTSGEALIDGVRICEPPKEMALVFQDYTRSLMPWLTVEKNVLLPLRETGLRRSEMKHRLQESLAQVGLSDVLHKYPWQLSGGMQQRVAIARALAYRPEILLMDEPFASLDAQTRFDLEDLLLTLRRELNITVVFVTHDIDESVYLSDRIVVLGSAPCRTREIVDVPLGSTRNQIETRSRAEFSELRTHILTSVKAGALN
ncbi:ABC transporter ATP-binding protein [Specibacter cremeus]|uniref:ABC transporter ATP-binding protein n=1 Tax=Specibacter cremeus TaxID=1629051 RepID=UPI000F766453|nr:ABC transporter ATP-binding protein [Specibacter cremeus]